MSKHQKSEEPEFVGQEFPGQEFVGQEFPGQEFDSLMTSFRQACVHTARREQAALGASQPLAVVIAGHVPSRWLAPALCAALLAVAGSGWSVWEYSHSSGQGQGHNYSHNYGPDIAAHGAARHGGAAASDVPAVSDDALLTEVQSDLSDQVPQALAPLAVSYNGNLHARSGQEQQ